MTSTTDPAANASDPWAFLTPWLTRLRGRVRVCVTTDGDFSDSELADPQLRDRDRVRLGGGDDSLAAWLRVELLPRAWRLPWPPEVTRTKSAAQCERYVRRELRGLREALLLVGVFAHVAYTDCLARLQSVAGMDVPLGVDMVDFPMRFRVELDGSALLHSTRYFYGRVARPSPEQLGVLAARAWQAAFGRDKLSAGFTRDLARLSSWLRPPPSEAASIAGVSIPLRLRFRLAGHHLDPAAQDVASVQKLQAMIRQLYSTLDRPNPTQRSFPLFMLDALIVDVDDLCLHPDVVNAVSDLVESVGVPFQSLRLPATRWTGDVLIGGELFAAWTRLVRLVTGLSSSSAASGVAQVRLASVHADHDFAPPLFSALALARGVRGVFLQTPRRSSLEDAEIQHRLMSWLAHALLSDASTSSVQTLSLHLTTLSEATVAAMEEIATGGRRGLALLWEMTTYKSARCASPIDNITKTMTVAASTALSFSYGDQTHFMHHMQLTHSTQASIVWRDHARNLLHLLVPGYGFCFIKEEQQQDGTRVKRQRLASVDSARIRPPSLSTFILCIHRVDDVNAAVLTLLPLVGRSLTSLRLDCQRLEDNTVDAIMAHCPRLLNLRLVVLQLKSMDPFVRGYYEHGVLIESLCLDGPVVSPDKFAAFLELLAVASPIQKTLRRLSVGRHWWRPWTDALHNLSSVLDANRRLSFLEIPLLSGFNESHEMLNRAHDGTRVAEPFDLTAKCAFLSVSHANKPPLQLDRDSVASIFAFAATSVRRSVRLYDSTDERNFARD